jgi:hypothetical protein
VTALAPAKVVATVLVTPLVRVPDWVMTRVRAADLAKAMGWAAPAAL